MKPTGVTSISFSALAVIALFLSALMSEAQAQEAEAQKHLKLLKTYDLGAGRWSEGLDFYDGFLWHTSSGSLYKLNPDSATDIDYDGDYDLFSDKTWDFTHHSHSESSVWFNDELYNFTYRDRLGSLSDDIYKLDLNVSSIWNNETYGWLHVGDGQGTTNWGSCRDKRNPGESIIYTGHSDNLLMWYDPDTGNTTRTQKIPGIDAVEDLGMDRYGRVWASSYDSASYPGLYRIDPDTGEILGIFDGPDGLAIIDGMAIRSVGNHDVMYVTGKQTRYIWEYLVPHPASDPVADVKVNGQDGPLAINYGSNLIVDISLDPGSQVGNNADWWVVIASPFGWYRYNLLSVSFVPGFSVTSQGPLSAHSNFIVYSGSGLPIGNYTFYFGVDVNMNGSLDMGQAYYDTAQVTVQ
jgi:hypothetical protein